MKSTILLTSNKNKLREFQLYIPEMESELGEDKKEVLGTSTEVIIEKTKDIKPKRMVEDTILVVNGKELVDIRYSGNANVKHGDKLVWMTKLGYNSGEEVQVFTGKVRGTANFDRRNEKAFGFDDIFIPLGSDKTLFELGDNKGNFSARKLAIEKYKANVSDFSVKLEDIPVWTGKYQN